jgi:hypothetical protein
MQQIPSWEASIWQAREENLAVYGTGKFVTVFTTVCHLSSWARQIRSMSSHITASKPVLRLSSHLRLGFPSCILSSDFIIKILHAFLFSSVLDACPAHLIRFDLITRIIFGKEHWSLSSTLCSLLQSPVTSYLLDSNISSSVPYFRKPSISVPPSVRETQNNSSSFL